LRRGAMGVKVYGASDDLIEIEGDIREEFNVYDDERYLAFSDGTVVKVWYDEDGIWRVHVVAGGEGCTKTRLPQDDKNTEVLELEGVSIKWVVEGKKFILAKR